MGMPKALEYVAMFPALAMTLINRLAGIPTVEEQTSAFWMHANPLMRTPQDVAIRMRLIGLYDDSQYYEKMQYWGYSEDKAKEFLNSSYQYLDPYDRVRLGWREGKSDDVIATELVGKGYNPVDADKLVKVSHFYPSPGDLVRWQAREVFEPAMITKYGLDAEYGEIDKAPFFAAGMTEEQIKNYWMAHWEHASWTEVQEMLFRGQITEEDVWSWFRLVEIPPYWRQKMINVAYHPYTRVDIRRMHKIGVIGDDALKRALMDIGYDDERAEGMKEFYIQYNMQTGENLERDLTRSIIEKAYRVGTIGSTELYDGLIALGYDEDQFSFIHAILDQDEALDRATDWIGLLRSQVKAGLIDPVEAKNKLAAMGLASSAVEHWGNLFIAYAEEPVKIPSKTDIKNWVAHKTITEAEGKTYLERLGYADHEIYLYMIDWTGSEERYADWIQRMRDIAAGLGV